MFHIVICDDEQFWLEDIKHRLLVFQFQHNIEFEILSFSTAETLLNAPDDYNVLFLDIRLNNNEDGISIGKKLRDRGNTAIIILSTSVLNRYRDGYQIGVLRYLEKPFIDTEFDEATLSAIKCLTIIPNKIAIRYKTESSFVDINDILYISSNNRKRFVKTNDFEIQTVETLNSFQERLNVDTFFRIQKGFLINLHHVKHANKSEVLMTDNRALTFVKGDYQRFNVQFMKYLTGTTS